MWPIGSSRIVRVESWVNGNHFECSVPFIVNSEAAADAAKEMHEAFLDTVDGRPRVTTELAAEPEDDEPSRVLDKLLENHTLLQVLAALRELYIDTSDPVDDHYAEVLDEAIKRVEDGPARDAQSVE